MKPDLAKLVMRGPADPLLVKEVLRLEALVKVLQEEIQWRSGQPVENGQYLCAVMDCRKPVILSWYDDKKQWGEWTHGEYWEYFGNARVEYYMRLDDIPMPEGW